MPLPWLPPVPASSFLHTCGNALWRLDCRIHLRRVQVLNYAWVFLILAIIAAIFGFGGIAAAAAGVAKILFFIFIALFIIGLLAGRRAV